MHERPVRTTCRRGHPWNGKTEYWRNIVIKGRQYHVRTCRICMSLRHLEWKRRKDAVAGGVRPEGSD